MKPPAFQFYPKDYESDEHVKMMSLEQEGAFLRLLCHAWLHGSVPADRPSQGKICRVPTAKMARLWPGVSPCFVDAGDGRLVNQRLERQRQDQSRYSAERSESGRRGAEKRHGSAIAQLQPGNGSALAQPKPPSASATATTENERSYSQSEEPPPTPATPSEARAVAVDRLGAPCRHPALVGKVARPGKILTCPDCGEDGPPTANVNGVPEDQRRAYAEAVWEAFLAKTGDRVTRLASPGEFAVLKAWMDAGVPLRIVLRGIQDTAGKGSSLRYFAPAVLEAIEAQRQAVPL